MVETARSRIESQAPAERRTGRPRDPQVDEDVSQAVIDVLARCGMSGFTVEKVAAAAGVGKATVYRRWPCKEDLIQEVWQHIHNEFALPDTGDLRKDLLLLLGHVSDFFGDVKRQQAFTHIVAAAKVDAELGRRFSDFKQARGESVRQVIASAQRRGEIRVGLDPTLLAEFVVAGIFFRILVSGNPVDRTFVEEWVDVLVDGIAAR